MLSKIRYEIVNEWDDILALFPENKRDVYFSKKYYSLYENSKNRAFCIVCKDEEKVMIMPYLRGTIYEYYDFETVYGYGGPIANTDDVEWCNKAFDGIFDYLKDNNYICGFARLHPLITNVNIFNKKYISKKSDRGIQVLFDRQTIAIDTSQSIEDIWTKQISSKNRNMIRKAEKNKLEYKAEYDYASYGEFIALYRDTMQRLSADDFYYFNDNYFELLRRNFSKSSFLGTVRKDGKLICAAIFMFSDLYGHYHLEGSDHYYSSLGANNYLLWNVACDMHNLGIKEFHLGGGTTSNIEDPLYKFKKAFSPNIKQFHICKMIFNEIEYEKICNIWEINNKEKKEIYGNRLLKYRY